VTPPEDIAAAGQLACLLEVSAPKPGNVSPGHPFHDTEYEDFLASAVAIGPPLAAAATRPLGLTIRSAVEATLRWTRSNTNLGIILLLAPLARAAAREGGDLRSRLARVLDETTIADAAEAYAAIRLAHPGGLGQVSTEDVAEPPSVTLREAMGLAAERDAVAREYVTDFAMTFEIGVPALRTARQDGLQWSDAVVEAYVRLLGVQADSHIARKLGAATSETISRRAREILAVGGVRSAAGREALAAFDAELRDASNSRNPGTTADLTCAALFVVIIEDIARR
jgi:triphosphoribosyl-dephospho-CoA synthase